MINKLKEYKELISIIVFFIGGFIWIETQFPTKDDLQTEIATLNCLVEKYMILTQSQIRGQELEKQVQDLSKKINTINSNENSLSPALKLEFDDLKTEFLHRKNDLGQNKDSMQKICEELQRNVCRKGKL